MCVCKQKCKFAGRKSGRKRLKRRRTSAKHFNLHLQVILTVKSWLLFCRKERLLFLFRVPHSHTCKLIGKKMNKRKEIERRGTLEHLLNHIRLSFEDNSTLLASSFQCTFFSHTVHATHDSSIKILPNFFLSANVSFLVRILFPEDLCVC